METFEKEMREIIDSCPDKNKFILFLIREARKMLNSPSQSEEAAPDPRR